MLSDRVFFLHLKYEACWIIIQENQRHDKSGAMKQQKSRDVYRNFFSRAVDFSQKVENYKLKMLHAQSIEETVDLIKYVSSVSSRGNARTNDTTKISISNQVLKEEIFLASFPCLNPYVVHLILSEYNLYEFLNMTVEECCKILHSVPERFLKCFYSTAQRAVTSTQPNKYEDLFKSFDDSAIKASDSNGLNQSFQLKPFVENLDILQRYDKFEMEQKCQDLFDRKNVDELTEIGAQYSGQSMTLAQMKHPEISLQEIDLDYMSLKLSDKYECSQSSSDEHVYKTDSMSCHSSNSFTLSPREELKERSDSQSMYKELSHPISSIKSSYFDEIDITEQQNGIAHSSLIKRENELHPSSSILESSAGFLSQNSLPNDKKLSFCSKQFLYTPRKRKNEIDYLDQQNGAVYSSLIEGGNELNLSSNILKSSAESIASQSSLCPDEKLFFNFEQFLYTPRKRKNSDEFSESNIDISPPHLKKTCGIQKGRTSKTVTKQDFRSCNSPLKCQEILSYHSQNNKDLKSCPTVNMNNCYRSYR